MKRFSLAVVLLAALALLGCSQAPANRADPQTEKEIRALLQQFGQAYAKKDLKTLMGLMAPDPVLNIGAGPEQWMENRAALEEYFRRQFAQTISGQLDYELRYLDRLGDAAWAAGFLSFKIKTAQGDKAFICRFTVVATRQKGKWVMAHSHLSLPAEAESNTSGK
jgi:uncharacterized protein (TIGR02246 family)